CTEDAEEWWILKAAGANGGGDVHVLPPACTHVPACIALRPLDSSLGSSRAGSSTFFEGTGHFELFGLDYLPVEAACAPEDMMHLDKFDSMYLMEINRLPGLQSSRQNSADEDELYD
ncbi:hypothetical protein NGA_0131402, partial [Nannochloropsis gaditana CCMP526]|uniref:uncharacterized protein n=1 Tax=Nannochloropsis gaditana (strain CCMP526) TaxID=1093141 RepID=UPI00029F5BE3